MRRAALAGFVLCGLLVFAGLSVTSMRTKASTFDECAHVVAGYTALRFGDYRLTPDHPPLVHKLAALPLLGLDIRFREDDPTWALGRQWELGRRFLYRWNDADRLLFWSRLPIVLLGATLAASVFLWTRRHWGNGAACLALLLCLLSPDVLAHSQLVTTDMGITLFVFLSVIAFERLGERVSWPRVVAAGLAVGAAFATKFSALILLPVLAALGVARVLQAQPLEVALPGARRLRLERPLRRLLCFALVSLAIAAVAFVVVWAAYDFHYVASQDAAFRQLIPWSRLEPGESMIAGGVDLARRWTMLPESYLWGFLRFFKHQQARPAFLLGRTSETGFWYFFPVSFALKTPLALVLLLVVAAATWRRSHVSWSSEATLIVPVVLYALVSVTRGINIGHRHLLPLAPFLFAAAGRSAAWALASRPRRGPVLLVGALLAWQLLATARIHPHYLAYFNELAGGPSKGYTRLVDSSLDWGQDLRGLKPYMERRGIPRIKLSYFGTADPEYYGIAADLLPGYLPPPPAKTTWEVKPGDMVAISATNLQGLYLDPSLRPLLERLRAQEPIGNVGFSILIYRAGFSWNGP